MLLAIDYQDVISEKIFYAHKTEGALNYHVKITPRAFICGDIWLFRDLLVSRVYEIEKKVASKVNISRLLYSLLENTKYHFSLAV